MLNICSERNDEWSNEVRVRIEEAISDLHAAEARYHVDCYSRFVSNRFLTGKRIKFQPEKSKQGGDTGLTYLIDLLERDKLHIWNSLELFREYQSHGGELLCHEVVVQKLVKHFAGELVALPAPGYARL